MKRDKGGRNQKYKPRTKKFKNPNDCPKKSQVSKSKNRLDFNQSRTK